MWIPFLRRAVLLVALCCLWAAPAGAHPSTTPPLRSLPDASSVKLSVRMSQEPKRTLARRPRFSHRLVDVRYKSAPTHTRIALLLSRTVGGINHDYIPGTDRFPARVYIDLTPCVPLRKWSRVPYWIGDKMVGRIRIARNTLRTTRVVLELRRSGRYRVQILQRPMRILIDVSNKRLPAFVKRSKRVPQGVPKPWRRRALNWRHKHKHKSSALAIRHKGPLPRIPFAFRVRSIAIDPGHGGREDGAIGPRTGLREKKLTLLIARRVVRLLKRRHKIKVFLTRKRDRQVSLSRRAALAREGRADLLVSIHINAHTNRKVSGLSTYILDWSSRSFAARLLSSDPLTARENQGVHPRRFGTVNSILASLKRQSNLTVSRVLAIAVQRGMLRSVRQQHAWVRDLGVRKGLFYLLFAAQMPGILVEASYLSNKREERLLRTSAYRRRVAVGIADGISRFLKHTRRTTGRSRGN